MKLLLSVAGALNAVYRTFLFIWLIYCIYQQFKHRREIMERRQFDTKYPRRLH